MGRTESRYDYSDIRIIICDIIIKFFYIVQKIFNVILHGVLLGFYWSVKSWNPFLINSLGPNQRLGNKVNKER